MDPIGRISLIAVFLGFFFGDPTGWLKSDLVKHFENKELGGGKFAWFATKLGAIGAWWIILFALWFAFAVIKTLWRLA